MLLSSGLASKASIIYVFLSLILINIVIVIIIIKINMKSVSSVLQFPKSIPISDSLINTFDETTPIGIGGGDYEEEF
jgi:hypothetical protein